MVFAKLLAIRKRVCEDFFAALLLIMLDRAEEQKHSRRWWPWSREKHDAELPSCVWNAERLVRCFAWAERVAEHPGLKVGDSRSAGRFWQGQVGFHCTI